MTQPLGPHGYPITHGGQTDFDPGTNHTDVVSYHGAPSVDQRDLHAPFDEVPYTFEQIHPELQYTRGKPVDVPIRVLGKLATSFQTRLYNLQLNADAIQVVARNERRSAIMFQNLTAAGLISVGADPGAVLGGITGQGFLIPSGLLVPWGSYDNVFASATIAASILCVVEYFDN